MDGSSEGELLLRQVGLDVVDQIAVEVGRLAREGEALERHAVVHGRVLEACLDVELIDPRRQVEGRRRRAIVDDGAPVDDLDVRQRDRLARPLPVGLLLLPLDEARQVRLLGMIFSENRFALFGIMP